MLVLNFHNTSATFNSVDEKEKQYHFYYWWHCRAPLAFVSIYNCICFYFNLYAGCCVRTHAAQLLFDGQSRHCWIRGNLLVHNILISGIRPRLYIGKSIIWMVCWIYLNDKNFLKKLFVKWSRQRYHGDIYKLVFKICWWFFCSWNMWVCSICEMCM